MHQMAGVWNQRMPPHGVGGKEILHNVRRPRGIPDSGDHEGGGCDFVRYILRRAGQAGQHARTYDGGRQPECGIPEPGDLHRGEHADRRLDDVPAAALALNEPTVLFDVLSPSTTALT